MASTNPRAMPTADPETPTIRGLPAGTDLATCRRLAQWLGGGRAPAAVRRMENVLTMRNAPTVGATPAKTRRKVVTKESASSIRLAARAGGVPGRRLEPLGEGGRHCSAQVLLRCAGVGGHPDRGVGVFARRKRSCASALSNMTTLAPTSRTAKLAVPTNVAVSRAGPLVVMSEIFSPMR